MVKDALKQIVKAAGSFKKAKPAFADHPYFQHREAGEWRQVTGFLRSKHSGRIIVKK